MTTKSSRWAKPVTLERRKAMTPGRRDRIYKAKGKRCYICGDETGPFDIEHPVALGLGGSDKDLELLVICALSGPRNCHKIKTALDRKMIAKANGLNKKHTVPKEPSRLKGRGFAKGLSKRFDGTVIKKGIK